MDTLTLKKASLKVEDRHPEDIKAALRKRGFTLKKLALIHGLADGSSLSACLTRSMPAAEKRIAEALEEAPWEIWPSRYKENGERAPQGSHSLKCTQPDVIRNVKKVSIGRHG